MQTQFGSFFPNLFDSSSWASAQGTSSYSIVPSFSNPFETKKDDHNFTAPHDISKDSAEKKRKVLMSKMKSDTSALHSNKKQATETKKKELSVLSDLTKKLQEKEKQVGEREKVALEKTEEAKKNLAKYQEQLKQETENRLRHEERVLQLHKELKGEKVKYPLEWEVQSNNCELKELPKDSDEFKRLSDKVKESKKCNILKIERIQNQWLWENYFNERRKLQEKNKDNNSERELFYGSGSAAPENIYNSEEGFDMRYSERENEWGQGIYFSEKAHYSDTYAYEKEGTRSIFLAKVLVGVSTQTPPDSSLRLPPPKKTSQSELNFKTERYDSVFAEKKSLFVVYAHGRAYPSYLITFQNEEIPTPITTETTSDVTNQENKTI